MKNCNSRRIPCSLVVAYNYCVVTGEKPAVVTETVVSAPWVPKLKAIEWSTVVTA